MMKVARRPGAKPHQQAGQPVNALTEASFAEEQESNKGGLQKERERALHRQ
jgi:hypothetical protein